MKPRREGQGLQSKDRTSSGNGKGLPIPGYGVFLIKTNVRTPRQ